MTKKSQAEMIIDLARFHLPAGRQVWLLKKNCNHIKVQNRAMLFDFFAGEFSSIFDQEKWKNWAKNPLHYV
ncbi:hypothetical protein [Algoriphagus sp.]|uniref:hypothetical protein n=1 Tax=Algoriphagus sp. TaxID=1872435 RepID=UPI00391B5CD5